jgi:lysophospholipase L1-like esterase
MLSRPQFRRAALNAALYYARQNRLERQGGAVVPLPDPTTVNFTSAQVSPGFSGSVSTTKNAARVYARGSLTLWSGYISGTEAKITAPSDFGDNDGSLEVAIDGGAFSTAARTGSVYTLFTGLEHATRFVEFRWVALMAAAPYIASSGNVLEVTGQPPALTTLANKVQTNAASSTGLYSGAVVANLADYAPPLQAEKGTTYGSNIGSAKIRGAFTKMVVTVNGSRKIAVSKNGAAPTYYTAADESGDPVRAIVVPCDGSTATYYVWDDGNYHSAGGTFSIAVDSTLLDIGVARRMDQYGDSITFGPGPGATSIDVDTMLAASALGFVGSTNGINGLTIAGCKTMLDTVLPLRTITSDDVAILAIGGNSAGDGIDATDEADYGLCIDKLLAKAYGKILCRGILPIASVQTQINAANAALKAVMDAKANARLVWVDPTTWTGYTSQDGTHPDDDGYVHIADDATPAYATALGL